MTFYDAFAGIGGFHLGLSRAGMKCVGACEINDYARKVYEKRFGIVPDKDIREVKHIKDADLLCGGFPCQDISVAGKGVGLSGKRSSLWWELARLIEDCLPRWVLLENVPALRKRGLREIVSFFAKVGYDAEWDCIRAQQVGTWHKRDRIWIVAYTNSKHVRNKQRRSSGTSRKSQTIIRDSYWQKHQPSMGRVANGVSDRMDRLKCLGNAVVPQIVEWIGKRIMEANNPRHAG